MMSPKEYVDKYKGKGPDEVPDVFWVNGVDLMAHLLKFDPENTINPSDRQRQYEVELSDAISEAEKRPPEEFFDSFDNAFIKKKKRKPVMDIEGDLDVDEWLNKNQTPFENSTKVEVDSKCATSVFINFWVSYMHRGGCDVEKAYQECYSIAASHEAEGRPCRVVGVFPAQVYGYKNDRTIALLIVLKDYNDPIFPTMWASIENNRVANALVNCICRYFIGTTVSGNSRAMGDRNSPMGIMENFCDPDENVITFGKYIRAYKNNKFRGLNDD